MNHRWNSSIFRSRLKWWPEMTTLALATPPFRSTAVIAVAALRLALRDRTIVWLAFLFMSMVLVAAYLGWAATQSLDAIYHKAVPVLQALGKPVPSNPALEVSPLSALRNMTTYVSLLGALAALVFGNQLVAADRKSGTLPLIASRAITRASYALGKIAALLIALSGLLLIAAIVNALAISALPGQPLTGVALRDIAIFYSVSALYLTFFGLAGAFFAATCRSEGMALLLPVTIWLALTFVLPQITGNINPMAALNPVSATVPPPGGAFFAAMNTVLGPLSLAEIFRGQASAILGYWPAAGMARSLPIGTSILAAADIACAIAFLRAIYFFDASRSGFDD